MMILVMAGTSDARELAVRIKEAGYNVVATVVTDNATIALKEAGIDVRVGRLTSDQMVDFILTQQFKMVVDATHPFAEEASKNGKEAANKAGVPYIRYERASFMSGEDKITYVDSYEQAADLAAEKPGVVMLTTGSKTLATFTNKLLGKEGIRLIARMLPRKDNMEKCEQLGVEQKNIVAIQGPFSKELNKALFEQFAVTMMITKESGKVGSVDEKVEAAKELGIPIVMIRRPKIDYGAVGSTYEEVLSLIRQKEEEI